MVDKGSVGGGLCFLSAASDAWETSFLITCGGTVPGRLWTGGMGMGEGGVERMDVAYLEAVASEIGGERVLGATGETEEERVEGLGGEGE